MALTLLQSDILRCLAKNRSETSYLAGGLMLNKNWQRRSDDFMTMRCRGKTSRFATP